MTTFNPTYHFAELEDAQSNPEVPVNLADRITAAAIAGKKTIDFASDADKTLQATSPPVSSDEWYWRHIEMTDTGVVLTAARDVLFPDVDALVGGGPTRHRFLFTNLTAQTLTVKMDVTGATGVAVAAGSTLALRVNSAGNDIEADTGSETVIIQLAASDLATALSPATSVAYFRSPRAFTLTEVRASLLGADTTDNIVVDINKNGTTILSTKITIEQGDKTSLDASTANQPVISDPAVSDDDEITIDHDSGGTDATGLIITLIGIAGN